MGSWFVFQMDRLREIWTKRALVLRGHCCCYTQHSSQQLPQVFRGSFPVYSLAQGAIVTSQKILLDW